MKMRYLAIGLIGLLLAVTAMPSSARSMPRLSLGSATTSPGGETTLPLSLSGGDGSYAGVNARLILPAGVSLISLSRGELLTPAFFLELEPSTGTVLAYAGAGGLRESEGVLLYLHLRAAPDLAEGSHPIRFAGPGDDPLVNAGHALASADGSVSVAHSTQEGTLVIGPRGVITISATASPVEGGTVTGDGEYDSGDTVALRATANAGWEFVRWTEAGIVVHTESTWEFDAENSRNLLAVFQRKQHAVAVAWSEGGRASGGGSVDEGADAEVQAEADVGHVFVNWTEEVDGRTVVVSVDANYSFSVTGPRALRANFVEERPGLFLVSLAAYPHQGGTVHLTPEGSQAGDHYAFFDSETDVTVTAKAKSDWYFENWSEAGEIVEGAGEDFILESLDDHRYLTATFAEVQPIPTLSEWGMIILAGLLLLFGAFMVRKHGRNPAQT